jgi:cysteinyl-tRNA synthetase
MHDNKQTNKMALQFYNTLTRKKDKFIPVYEGEAKIYSCGPTIYGFVHIGNLRAFMCSDILRRYLKYKGYKVTHVMNLTDVDDKTIRDSIKKGVALKVHTEPYAISFFENLKTLNIEPVEHYPRATETIYEMVALVTKLLDKGYAYKASDGIYFSISKFNDYGKLAKLQNMDLLSGASKRIKSDEYDKDSAHDFVLWKFWDEKDGDVFWETEIGKGRPGWHIECSAMSMKYLSESFDIHTGGIDLIFPHHENEIAQSEAATGKQFVNYWLHNEYMLVNDEKMSKSLNNFYKLSDILDKGYNPAAVRYLLMSSQYRQKLNFTFDGLEAADKAINRLTEFKDAMLEVKKKNTEDKDDSPNHIKEKVQKLKDKFEENMDDDLNISGALGVLFEFIREMNKLNSESKISKDDAEFIIKAIKELDSVFGILEMTKEENHIVPEDIIKIAELRKKAKSAKDWAEADRLRDELKDNGYIVIDSKDGYKLKKA